MTDVSPNNDWLPPEWLIPATHAGSFAAANLIDYHRADPRALASKIDQFATNPDMFAKAQEQAGDIARALSWAALLPRYEELLSV
jgi:hypothetical protein